MHVLRIWHPGLRIIEVGATAGALGEAFVRAGYQHYLGVTPSQRARSRIAAAYPRLQTRLTVAKPSAALCTNNAEVLVLHGAAALSLARYHLLRQAHYVALPMRPSPGILVGLLVALVQWLCRRLDRPTVVHLNREGRGSFRLVAFGVRHRREPSARRHIPHSLGIERFLRRLNRGRVRYVVLRSFEPLPVLPPGQALTVLVDDADLPTVAAMLDEGPGLQPIDLYSTTGLAGADYQGMPYFPPHLAEQILDAAQPRHGLCWVPSAEDHFHSLVYHALYHKGFASGLSGKDAVHPRGARSHHDYATTLKKLARREGIDVPIVLEDLDRYLHRHGWRPTDEMLVRLARENRWVQTILDAQRATGQSPPTPPHADVTPPTGRRAA